jgi:CheY-like chemotaxis protein
VPAARVLLVHDDEAVLELVAGTLTREGLRIMTAVSPARALEPGRQSLSFDVVLCGVTLPGMTGFRFQEAYRQRTGHQTPFVFLAGGEQAARLPIEAPDRLLVTPFSPTDLRSAVYAALQLVHVVSGPLPGQLDPILKDVEESRGTGVITAVHGASVKRVVVENGDVVFAFSNEPRDLIGQAFLRAGLISEKELLQAFAAASAMKREPGVPALSAALAGLRKVTPEQSRRVFERKIRESVLDLFLWSSGMVEFVEEPLTRDDRPFPAHVETKALRAEGKLRRDRWTAVRRILPDADVRFQRARPFPGGFPRTNGEKSLVRLIESGATFGEILVEFRGEDYAVGLRLADLVKRGALETAAPAPAFTPSPSQDEKGLNLYDEFDALFGELSTELANPPAAPAAPQPPPKEDSGQVAVPAFARAMARFRSGDLPGARRAFLEVLDVDPMNLLARHRLDEVERAIVALARKNGLTGTQTVRLAVGIGTLLGRKSVFPNDAFVLSRLAAGPLTVGDLVLLCPFPEHEVLEIVQRFESEGVLTRS